MIVLKIFLALTTAVVALCGCRTETNVHKLVQQAEERSWGNKTRSIVDLNRLKLADRNDSELDPSVLQKPILTELKVALDGKELAGNGPTYTQLSFCKRLAAKIKSKMDGASLYLPWGKSTALVAGFAAISLPGDANKILICGGDESPNRIRFAPDKTWLVDLPTGIVSEGPDMNWPRKYPTLTALTDGKILISGGSGGKGNGGESLTGASGLEKLPLELETFDPKTNTIARAGALKVPRDETAVVVLANGLILIAGGDRARDEQAESLQLALQPVTAELYNPATQQSIMLGRLKSLTAITWSAPVGSDQALLLGSHWGMYLGNEQLGEPAGELIDTSNK